MDPSITKLDINCIYYLIYNHLQWSDIQTCLQTSKIFNVLTSNELKHKYNEHINSIGICGCIKYNYTNEVIKFCGNEIDNNMNVVLYYAYLCENINIIKLLIDHYGGVYVELYLKRDLFTKALYFRNVKFEFIKDLYNLIIAKGYFPNIHCQDVSYCIKNKNDEIAKFVIRNQDTIASIWYLRSYYDSALLYKRYDLIDDIVDKNHVNKYSFTYVRDKINKDPLVLSMETLSMLGYTKKELKKQLYDNNFSLQCNVMLFTLLRSMIISTTLQGIGYLMMRSIHYIRNWF